MMNKMEKLHGRGQKTGIGDAGPDVAEMERPSPW
jgi:hypothetical protein